MDTCVLDRKMRAPVWVSVVLKVSLSGELMYKKKATNAKVEEKGMKCELESTCVLFVPPPLGLGTFAGKKKGLRDRFAVNGHFILRDAGEYAKCGIGSESKHGLQVGHNSHLEETVNHLGLALLNTPAKTLIVRLDSILQKHIHNLVMLLDTGPPQGLHLCRCSVRKQHPDHFDIASLGRPD